MADKITPEDLAYNRRVKKVVVETLFEVCETFYLHCVPHPDLYLGGRGLIDKEKEEGIVLVFGPYSARRLSWDERGIDCDMHFARWEPVHIPWECVHRAFDKPGQFLMQWVTMNVPEPTLRDASKLDQEEPASDAEPSSGESPAQGTPEKEPEKIIEVDFTKRKKK